MFNIVLYQPQIPPNTGNIARLCVATKSKLHIIRPIAFFLDDKTMRRAGCDYWKHLDLQCYNSLEELKSKAGDANFFYVTKYGEKKYSDVTFKDGDYLVFGSEQHGLPKEIIESNKEKTIVIPMAGPTRSLNLSSSAAIVLYEAIRQTK
jgi:tRNA (cytidine/uridine-2'-O-)-methyltransferase